MINDPKKQIRLQQYDYSQPGYYFVTICAQDRKELFGTIKGKAMGLNRVGDIANELWKRVPNSYSFISLDEFIVMPNHIHGIVIINPSVAEEDGTPRRAATQLRALTPNSLSSIINHYKGAVKKECNRLGFDFAWQPRFYDHVIRKDESLDKIRE